MLKRALSVSLQLRSWMTYGALNSLLLDFKLQVLA